MGARVGGFTTTEEATLYYEIYDRFIDKNWPIGRVELDVQTEFGSTHVGRSGTADGIPLVLIHPTTGSSLGWHSIIEPLVGQHTVYTPDTIGTIGRSVQTGPIETPEDLVHWLDQVLDRLELPHIHLLGYSEGGWIAGLHAAITNRPERLASLTLIEPGGAIEQIPGRTLAAMIYRGARTLVARDKPQAIRDFSRWLSGDFDLNDDEVELVLTAFRAFRQHLPRPKRLSDSQLQQIGTRTLLMLGADTRIYDPAKVADRASRLISHVEIETTPNAGHGLPFQYPDQITRRILTFTDSTTGSRPDPDPT